MTDAYRSIVSFDHSLLTAAVSMFVEVFNAPPWDDRWTLETANKRLVDLLDTPGYQGVAILDGDRLVGFVAGYRQRWWDSDHFLVAEMVVRRDVQGRGHGRALLDALVGRLDGVTRLYLLTASNSPAHQFYLRCGFRAARRQGVMIRELGR